MHDYEKRNTLNETTLIKNITEGVIELSDPGKTKQYVRAFPNRHSSNYTHQWGLTNNITITAKQKKEKPVKLHHPLVDDELILDE